MTLPELLDTAATPGGIFGKHLERYWQVLQTYPLLLAAFGEVLRGNGAAVDAHVREQLRGLGLVRLEGDEARVRYGFYRTYFRERLGI